MVMVFAIRRSCTVLCLVCCACACFELAGADKATEHTFADVPEARPGRVPVPVEIGSEPTHVGELTWFCANWSSDQRLGRQNKTRPEAILRGYLRRGVSLATVSVSHWCAAPGSRTPQLRHSWYRLSQIALCTLHYEPPNTPPIKSRRRTIGPTPKAYRQARVSAFITGTSSCRFWWSCNTSSYYERTFTHFTSVAGIGLI
ncbi:hypothetical protein EDB84DRAFT_570891 [Lactarius hengduanensis]|nr:hypothetical protein EDB84DRAFT_570891 [Lactarius hengduanensis]